MRYGSVCSGIEAATVAWEVLGWNASFFSEIEKFPRAVLHHHYPDTPLHGDFTTIGANEYDSIDLLVGGTPCQSFSISGLRKGMDDDRGNLALEYLRLAERTGAKWLVWENVPGVLSSNEGRDFGAFLGGLEELGYGFCWRVLNAKNWGVAQNRRRVFLVGYLGDWRPPAAALIERQGLSGYSEPSRKKRKSDTSRVDGCADKYYRKRSHGDYVKDQKASTLTKHEGKDNHDLVVGLAQNQRNEVRVMSKSGALSARPGMKQQTFIVHGTQDPCVSEETAFAMGRNGGRENVIFSDDFENIRKKTIRRLSPIECERLMGFPDNYTKIPFSGKSSGECKNSPRYQALGNSMAVPVMRWIGERIDLVEGVLNE